MAFQPISLLQAQALAKLQEEKLRDKPAPMPRGPVFSKPSFHQNATVSTRPKSNFVQRTPAEMAFRREKGLCYNCDEKWHIGHRCKGKVMLFIAEDQAPSPDSMEHEVAEDPGTAVLDNPEPSVDSDCSHISLHALAGLPSSETFRIYGTIRNAMLTILVDSGSTHNFLQPRIAQFLHLRPQSTQPLRVMVGNGAMLTCDQVCPRHKLLYRATPSRFPSTSFQ